MTQQMITVFGSIVGVLISGVVAFFVSRYQARNEILKVGMQIDASYRAKLYERRLAVYPELAKCLANLGSAIRAGRCSVQAVRDTWDVVREWDAAHSIFMSPLSMTAMIALRKTLIPLSSVPDEAISNKKARNDLLPAIINLQLALKTELGVMHADGFHKPHRAPSIREAMANDDDSHP